MVYIAGRRHQDWSVRQTWLVLWTPCGRALLSDVVGLPGPTAGQVQRLGARVAGQAAGEREQPATIGARVVVCWQAEQFAPAQQVMGQAGDHRPGGVGRELAGGEVRERFVFTSPIAGALREARLTGLH
jgi:hypothetical protein